MIKAPSTIVLRFKNNRLPHIALLSSHALVIERSNLFKFISFRSLHFVRILST